MKTVILITGILVCIIAVHAVTGPHPQEGSIVYEVKVDMHRTIRPDRQEMKDMIPPHDIFRERLLFKGGESLYKPVEDESEDEFSSDGGGMRMRIRRPAADYYTNLNTGRKLRAQEFFGKKYLIEDSLKILPWKIQEGRKTILGYECREASWFNEERKQQVTVWYAEKLKPFLGPENYNSLPGTVLHVDINNGERTITAVEVSFDAVKKNEIREPSSGFRTTEKDFRTIVEEQMKKMGGQGDRMMIRRN